MANQGVVYLVAQPPSIVAASKPPNGHILLVDLSTLLVTATIFDPTTVVGIRLITVFATVPELTNFLRDHPEKMSRLAGINMHPNQILIFQARRYTFKPWVQGDQVVTLVPIFHQNDLVIRPRPVEVPLGDILDIGWEVTPPAHIGAAPTVIQLQEPDPDTFFDGSSKLKMRYAVEIGMPIPSGPAEPRSAVYKAISNDSGVANFCKNFFSGDPLVHLDPPMVLVLVLGSPQVSTITAVNNARREYFRTNIDQEMNQGGFPWFDVALKTLENATMVFFTLAVTNPNQQPFDYEYVRPSIQVCRYLITGILRRAGRETQPPSSLQCRTPAWYYKDTEEAKKQKEQEMKAKKGHPLAPPSPLKKRVATDDAGGTPPPPPVGPMMYNAETDTWYCGT